MEYNEVISNVGIYDLEESLVASGYPKRTKNIIHDLNMKDFERGQGLVEATLKGICKYFNLKMMEMVVTNKRVVCKTGIISVNTEELKNQRIESVEIKQTLWQRIWGYADIYFTGTGVSYVIFSNIRDARSVKSILEDNIDI